MALPRRRGPMSMAQKAALKKAQEISARKRRGTGKIELKKTRPTAKDYRDKGRQMAQKDGVAPGSTARKVRIASRANATGSGGRSGNERTKFDARSGNQTVTQFTPKQRAAAFKKAAGLPAKKKAANPSSTTPSKKKSVFAESKPGSDANMKHSLANSSEAREFAAQKKAEGYTNVTVSSKPSNVRGGLGIGSGMYEVRVGDYRPEGDSKPKPETRSSTTPSKKQPAKIDDFTKFDDLSDKDKKMLSGIADMIDKINDDIVGSKNMRYTADGLRTFDNSDDPDAPGNDQTLGDFIDGINEAIKEMDDLSQGTPKEKSARKKLMDTAAKVESLYNFDDPGAGDARSKTTAKDYRAQGDKSRADRITPMRGMGNTNKRGNPVRSRSDRAAGVRRGAGSKDPVGEALKARIKVNDERLRKSMGMETRSSTMASTDTPARDVKPMDPKKLRADYIKARDSGMSKAYVDKAKRLFDSAQKESADLNRMMRIDGYLKDGRRPSSIELDWLEEQWRLKKLSPYARKRARAILDDFEKRSATRKWKGETGSPNLKGYSQGL